MLQLWHGTDSVESICLGDVGFDVRLAHKHGVTQALLDSMGWGGHVYGRGAYFAEAALYSHWWFARKHAEVDDTGAEQYTLILAHVFTGRAKDYGPSWAPDLSVEPPGYHSVCGTESDQKLLPVVRPSPAHCHVHPRNYLSQFRPHSPLYLHLCLYSNPSHPAAWITYCIANTLILSL